MYVIHGNKLKTHVQFFFTISLLIDLMSVYKFRSAEKILHRMKVIIVNVNVRNGTKLRLYSINQLILRD